MLVNANCTIYEAAAGTYTRHEIRDVYWNDARGRTVSKGGIQITDGVLVYLYDDTYVPKDGDLIVYGLVTFEFNAQSQPSVSDSMKLFRAQFPKFAVVKNVVNAMYGGLPHIELIAR